MADTWLESVPYGGFAGGTPESHALVGQSAAHPGQSGWDQIETTATLVGGLALITGGGAAVGYFVAKSTMGALIGALLGLGYSAATLAINTSSIATENARLAEAAARDSAAAGRGSPR